MARTGQLTKMLQKTILDLPEHFHYTKTRIIKKELKAQQIKSLESPIVTDPTSTTLMGSDNTQPNLLFKQNVIPAITTTAELAGNLTSDAISKVLDVDTQGVVPVKTNAELADNLTYADTQIDHTFDYVILGSVGVVAGTSLTVGFLGVITVIVGSSVGSVEEGLLMW